MIETGTKRTCGRRRKCVGFTMIEAALVLFLFSVIALTFYQLFALGSKRILDVRRKLGAAALVSERMEMVRSLPYDSIGTKRPDGSGGWNYGIPPGDILETEEVVRGGATFTVHTLAQFTDDAFDGTAAGSPEDTIPTDYKRVRVEVTWPGAEGGQEVVAWSTFAPEGVEQPTNTGTLSINVFDTSGAPVQGALVHIKNDGNDIDLSAETDVFGNQSWPGTPPGGDDYSIEVTKDGYCGSRTYPPYPDSPFDPLTPPFPVIGRMNQKAFTIDRVSGITVRSEDLFGNGIPDVPFSLTGGSQVGTEPPTDPPAATPIPVYGFSSSGNTGSDSESTYVDLCCGRYMFSSIGTVPGYHYLGLEPGIVDADDAFEVPPGNDVIVRLIYMKDSLPSVLFSVTFLDGSDSIPLEGAEVRLRNGALGYDETVTAGISGKAYFPVEESGLSEGTYEYEVTASGFETETGSVNVTSSGLLDRAISLSAS
ncbi:MAG: hypothetical protein HGB34_02430 [Candidatus Moranbacteria bacterium]|nr:hypothetical protein [Candidatus Moranbacteria bacterium]